MVSTAINLTSSGITSQLLFVQQVSLNLKFHRQLDGSLRMEGLIVLPNLLRVVYPCKDFFLRFTILILVF